MRTAIFAGFMYLAGAVNPNLDSGETVTGFIAAILVCAIIMDLIEFLKKNF